MIITLSLQPPRILRHVGFIYVVVMLVLMRPMVLVMVVAMETFVVLSPAQLVCHNCLLSAE